jgi:hypothetical protein
MILFLLCISTVGALWTQKYLSTLEELLRIDRIIKDQDSSCHVDDRPYFNGLPRRWDKSPLGSLELKRKYHDSLYGNVYSAKPERISSEVVVKYQADCSERLAVPSLPHPLIDEFMFMSFLNHTAIAPKVYHLSPPLSLSGTVFADLGTSRFLGMSLQKDYSRCAQAGAEVRFLVQEQVGPALSEYVKAFQKHHEAVYMSTVFSKQMIKIARRLISILGELHSYGIIHNDIHKANIAFRTSSHSISLDTDDIVLIDFGLASFFPSKFGAPIKIQKRSRLNPVPLSVWEVQDQRSGPRDDVYRVILLLASLLSRGKYSGGVEEMRARNFKFVGNPQPGSREKIETDWAVMAHIKTNLNLFKRDFNLGSGAHIGVTENRLQILDVLQEIESHVKSYPHPDSPVEYDYIILKFDEILALFP